MSSLSADLGAHSWYTEAAGGHGDTSRLTQVSRARQQRGLTLIPASSPEAWGRSTRAVRTVPDRLLHERALAGRTERAAANRYLTEEVLPPHNKRVRGRATEPSPAFIAWVGTSLAGGLGVQDESVVATDHMVRDRGTTLQIPQDSPRFHDVTVPVRVHESPCGILAVLPWPRCLARNHADGPRIETGGAHPGPTYRSNLPPIVAPRVRVRNQLSARA